jgi:hypothetical protein
MQPLLLPQLHPLLHPVPQLLLASPSLPLLQCLLLELLLSRGPLLQPLLALLLRTALLLPLPLPVSPKPLPQLLTAVPLLLRPPALPQPLSLVLAAVLMPLAIAYACTSSITRDTCRRVACRP